MANLNRKDLTNASEHVTAKAATLVETAADLAERAFEHAVDHSNLTSADTSNKLVRGARETNKTVRKHSREIGLGAMIAVVLAVVGAIVTFALRAGRSNTSDD